MRPDAGLDAGEELVTSRPQAEPAARAEPAPEPAAQPQPKPETKPEVRPAHPPAVDDAARARALLEGKSQPAAAAAATAPGADGGRFIVQVGAFADADKVREVRARLERAGLKTYAQAVQTKEGRRTRVRLGPFESRSEADKALARAKALGLDGSVLTL